ncbi:MAG TPA: MGMT family protein [Ilumatobacter sp.]|nr:MGMT family protein [Ilumatobacter sp.]
MNDVQRRIVDVLLALGEGEVTTYGDVAEVAGYPKRARFVGHVLAHSGELAVDVPWWRVVNSAGRLVPGHEAEQAQLLRAEGVSVAAGHVRNAPVGRFSRPPATPRRQP